MYKHRIDLRRIKTSETEPHIKGGQGTISIGTIIPLEVPTRTPEQLPTNILEAKVAIKQFEWDREDVEHSAKFFKVDFVVKNWACAVFLMCPH